MANLMITMESTTLDETINRASKWSILTSRELVNLVCNLA